jgi:hypothetical protein
VNLLFRFSFTLKGLNFIKSRTIIGAKLSTTISSSLLSFDPVDDT